MPSPRRVAAGSLLAMVALVLVVLGIGWSQRRPIATDVIARALAKRGVPARFRVAAIGIRTQRLEDLSIGDPRHPDLTAQVAEVRVALGLGGVVVKEVKASGVRLRGRIVAGRLSLGTLDRLLPQGGRTAPGEPMLPNMRVDLRDARALIETGAGQIGLAADGAGSLESGFSGRVALFAPELAIDGCVASRVRAVLNLSVVGRQPLVDGPILVGNARCAGANAADLAFALDLRLSPDLAHWRGGLRAGAPRATLGAVLVSAPAVQIGFEGDRTGLRSGVDADAAAARFPGGTAQPLDFSGRLTIGAEDRRLSGRLRIGTVALDRAPADRLVRASAALAGTPVGPLARGIAQSLASAARATSLDVMLGVASRPGRAAVELEQLQLGARSGASARLDGKAVLLLPGGKWRVDGALSAGGGGLPQSALLLRQAVPGGELDGVLRIEPVQAGEARLALRPVSFSRRTDGAIAFSTEAVLSGPLFAGRIEDLRLPLAGRLSGGTLLLDPGCTDVAFARLSQASLAAGPARLRLCPANGGALVRIEGSRVAGGAVTSPVSLAGHLGQTPIALAARRANLDLGRRAFGLEQVHVRLGEPGSASVLDLASFDGSVGGAVLGSFAGGTGRLAAVPLLLSDASGRWQVAGGALGVTADARVSDLAKPIHFRPLRAASIRLRLGGSTVDGGATLIEPASGTIVATVSLRHLLGAGRGEARFAVPDLAFGRRLQPDALTPLTLGVVANVAGHVRGTASIRWGSAGVTSDGSFATDKLDLAAAFGPVAGIAGTLRFSDLLGLATPAGQEVRIASINPGVEVTDGRVRYQLLPGLLVKIEGGTWPFAGGTLRLEPTTLDFDVAATRRMTLAVSGLDAAKFIDQLKFENIAATGTFDGTVPLVFSAAGNRIDGGHLVARAGGGTLSYVGEVSNAQLGTFGKLAFDALKSLRYKSLAIDMDGALDGEIVSKVAVNGINQQPVGARIGGMSKQLTGLPFRFNIAIKAPFRGLMNSARTFSDPGSVLGAGAVSPPVQPK